MELGCAGWLSALEIHKREGMPMGRKKKKKPLKGGEYSVFKVGFNLSRKLEAHFWVTGFVHNGGGS